MARDKTTGLIFCSFVLLTITSRCDIMFLCVMIHINLIADKWSQVRGTNMNKVLNSALFVFIIKYVLKVVNA